MISFTNLKPYLKFIAPLVLTLVGAALHGLLTGEWNMTEMEVALVGVLSASLTFMIENGTKGLARYAKSLGPAALTILVAGVHLAFTGEINKDEIAIAVTGLFAASLALLVGNTSSAAVAIGPTGSEVRSRDSVKSAVLGATTKRDPSSRTPRTPPGTPLR